MGKLMHCFFQRRQWLCLTDHLSLLVVNKVRCQVLLERFSYDLEKSLFVYQPMDEKIKTWTLRFPAKENPDMDKVLFDWPIVLQYDVKAKISGKFSGVKFFHLIVRLTNQKPCAFVYPSHKPIKSLYLRSLVVSVLFACFRFKVVRKLL